MEDVPKKLIIFDLFRFADKKDTVLQITSAVCSIIAGLLVPSAYIIFGEITDAFIDFGYGQKIIKIFQYTNNDSKLPNA